MSIDQWEYSSQRVQWCMVTGQARSVTVVEFFKVPGVTVYATNFPRLMNWTVAT